MVGRFILWAVPVLGGIFVFMLVAFGPTRMLELLPRGAHQWLEENGMLAMLSGVSTMRGEPKADAGAGPMAQLDDRKDGWEVTGPIAAVPGGGAVWIRDVLSGYSSRVKGDAAGELRLIEARQDCTVTRPSSASHFAHAGFRGSSGLTPGLMTYGDEELAQAVQVLVNLRRDGSNMRPQVPWDQSFSLVDVAVTEVERPVYLVVEFGGGRRIVNIDLAPGASLERVVLIGADEAGVSNLPPGVPVEVVPDRVLAGCGARPFYGLNPNHLFYQSVAIGAIDEAEKAETLRDLAAQEKAWALLFERMFGQDAKATLAGGWNNGAVALAGPIPVTPEGRAVHKPFLGAPVVLTVARYLETPEMAGQGKGFVAQVEAIARAFAWGDLRNLRLSAEGL